MNTKHLFCLSGWGYLQDVIEKSGKFIVRIKALTGYDSSTLNRDDVWVNGEVTNENYQACLRTLLDLVLAGQCVMVNFDAEYSAFVNAYSGQAPEDPNHIVDLHAKLLSIRSGTVNGRIVSTEMGQLRAVV